MNKQAALEQIREEAFRDEMEKVALSTPTLHNYYNKSVKYLAKSINAQHKAHAMKRAIKPDLSRQLRRMEGTELAATKIMRQSAK